MRVRYTFEDQDNLLEVEGDTSDNSLTVTLSTDEAEGDVRFDLKGARELRDGLTAIIGKIEPPVVNSISIGAGQVYTTGILR